MKIILVLSVGLFFLLFPAVSFADGGISSLSALDGVFEGFIFGVILFLFFMSSALLLLGKKKHYKFIISGIILVITFQFVVSDFFVSNSDNYILAGCYLIVSTILFIKLSKGKWIVVSISTLAVVFLFSLPGIVSFTEYIYLDKPSLKSPQLLTNIYNYNDMTVLELNNNQYYFSKKRVWTNALDGMVSLQKKGEKFQLFGIIKVSVHRNSVIKESYFTVPIFKKEIQLYSKYLKSSELVNAPVSWADNKTWLTEMESRAGVFTDKEFRLLLSKGVDINYKNPYDSSPLHFLVRKSRVNLIELAIEYSADVNAQNKFGYTPLMLAYQFAHSKYEIIKILLDHGADPLIKNNDGKTVLDLMSSPKDFSIVISNDKNQEIKELLRASINQNQVNNTINSKSSIFKEKK